MGGSVVIRFRPNSAAQSNWLCSRGRTYPSATTPGRPSCASASRRRCGIGWPGAAVRFCQLLAYASISTRISRRTRPLICTMALAGRMSPNASRCARPTRSASPMLVTTERYAPLSSFFRTGSHFLQRAAKGGCSGSGHRRRRSTHRHARLFQRDHPRPDTYRAAISANLFGWAAGRNHLSCHGLARCSAVTKGRACHSWQIFIGQPQCSSPLP